MPGTPLAAAKVVALQVSLAMLGQHGGDADMEKVLLAKIAAAEKEAAAKEKSLAEKLAGTRG